VHFPVIASHFLAALISSAPIASISLAADSGRGAPSALPLPRTGARVWSATGDLSSGTVFALDRDLASRQESRR
jgi:hypothetical protein